MLTLLNITAGYRQVPVVKNIQFDVGEGEIVGLVGLNGAGKSTLLKTILGLLPPIAGTIELDGQTIQHDHTAYASELAYIPETPVLYDVLTLREHIEMTGLGYGFTKEEAMRRAEPLLKKFRLDRHLDWLPVHFSKGMKQKVMIINALITEAKVLIIDEPFLGLDPLAIRDFIQLLQERAAQGTSILFTTHILSIATEFCDRFMIMKKGEIIADGTINDLQTVFKQPTASIEDIYLLLAEEEVGEYDDASQ